MQKGNAFWFILLAIFLLGGLTAMLARSGNNTDDTGSTESDNIAASELLSYAATLQNGVNMLVQRGCSENQLSFWNDSNADGTEDSSDFYYNTNSPTDRSCHIFRPEGAGIPQKDLSKYLVSTTNTSKGWNNVANTSFGAHVTGQMSVTDIGSNGNTELLFTHHNIKSSYCKELNKILGISSSTIPIDGGYFHQNKFVGPYVQYDVGASIGNGAGGESLIFKGKKAGCYDNSASTYGLYYVLLAR